MTIKKPMKMKASAKTGDGAAPEGAGPVLNSRLRLDTAEPKKAAPSGPAVTVAFYAALVALGTSGTLAYMLWKHWEYLMPW